jgi:hypothetical protein
LEQALGKTVKSPVFPFKFKEAVPKTEVLEQPLIINVFSAAVKVVFSMACISMAVWPVCSRITFQMKAPVMESVQDCNFRTILLSIRGRFFAKAIFF